MSPKQIESAIQQEGFSPIKITDPPKHHYSKHMHPETKPLAFLEGSMDVIVAGELFRCMPGDKLLIPGNTIHEAVVGDEGCTFFWSEKLLS